jgi:hypothetical protein
MSRDDAGRFTNAATLARLVEEAIATPTREEETPVRHSAVWEGDQATDPCPPRPVSPARVGPSRHAHSRPFNDPSNYLG